MQCIPRRTIYTARTYTHSDTHGDMLSILFLAVAVTIMVVATNYSASGKDAVAAAEEKQRGSCHCVCVLRVHRHAFTFATCTCVSGECVFQVHVAQVRAGKDVFMKLVSFILGLVEAAGGIRSWKYPNTGKSLWLMMKWSSWFRLAPITLLLKQETGNCDYSLHVFIFYSFIQ